MVADNHASAEGWQREQREDHDHNVTRRRAADRDHKVGACVYVVLMCACSIAILNFLRNEKFVDNTENAIRWLVSRCQDGLCSFPFDVIDCVY